MKKKIFIMTLLSLMLTTGCGCNKKEDDTNKNNPANSNEPTVDNPAVITNPEMTKDQTVEALQFTSTGFTYDGNKTTLRSQVTNTSTEPVTLTTVYADITYTDEYDREKLLELEVYFGESLEPGETRSVLSTTDVDLRKSSKIEYRIVR